MRLKLLSVLFTLFAVSCLDPGAEEDEKESVPSVYVSYYLYKKDDDPSRKCIKSAAYIPNTQEGVELARRFEPDLQSVSCDNYELVWGCLRGWYYEKTVKSDGTVIPSKEPVDIGYIVESCP
ncbi:MAG: hypothetical protein LBP51_05480 [Deferribacteraceae bacterium]|jgi:hypothetical protein|nr:hypothetical protein [Deferribacteraceae bacterium]